MVPAASAARAPATSPPGSIIRVKPTGLISIGMETGVPSTVVLRSGPGEPTVTPMRGTNPTDSMASRFIARVRSSPAAPSM